MGLEMRTNMIRTLADISFGIFATSQLALPIVAQTSAVGGVYNWINDFGALGLCAFMIFQNYRQSEAMGKIITAKDAVIERRDQEIIDLTRDVALAIEKNTQALSTMTSSLGERPCMIKKET